MQTETLLKEEYQECLEVWCCCSGCDYAGDDLHPCIFSAFEAYHAPFSERGWVSGYLIPLL